MLVTGHTVTLIGAVATSGMFAVFSVILALSESVQMAIVNGLLSLGGSLIAAYVAYLARMEARMSKEESTAAKEEAARSTSEAMAAKEEATAAKEEATGARHEAASAAAASLETKEEVSQIHTTTNSMSEALLKEGKASAHAKGKEAGREQEKEEERARQVEIKDSRTSEEG